MALTPGRTGTGIRHLKRMADGNGKTVDETLDIVKRTADIDRRQHQAEYAGSGKG